MKPVKVFWNKKHLTIGSLGLLAILSFLSMQNFIGVTAPYDASAFRFISAESNNTLWPSKAAIDNNYTTSYSSNVSAVADGSGTYLIARLAQLMPISRLILRARMANGRPQGFPKLYEVFVADDNDPNRWIDIGSFGQQPDSLGVVSIDLGGFYLTQAIKIVPRVMGTDDYKNYYLQVAELRVMGPILYRLSSNVPYLNDGNDTTFSEIFKGSTPAFQASSLSPSYQGAVTLDGALNTEQYVSKLYLKGNVVNGMVSGFPEHFELLYTNSALAGQWRSLGDYRRKPDALGNLVVDLKGLKPIKQIRLKPKVLGAVPAGGYALQLAEWNLIGPLVHRLTSATSNESLWSPNSIIDGSMATAYSSNPFSSRVNTRNVFLAAWAPTVEPVSQVMMFARMNAGKPLGFPRKYRLHVTDPENTKWIDLGEFSTQPNQDGYAVVSFKKSYLTKGIVITPTEFGDDGWGNVIFQMAEVRLVGTSLGRNRRGSQATFSEFTLSAGQTLNNGSTKLSILSNGNVVVKDDLYGDHILWESGTKGRTCGSNCTLKFANGVLSASDSPTAMPYWTAQNFNAGSTFYFSRRFPYISVVDASGNGVWPYLQAGRRMSGGYAIFYELATDGNYTEVFTNKDGVQINLKDSKTHDTTCTSTNCVAVLQPSGRVVLYKNKVPYWQGKASVLN